MDNKRVTKLPVNLSEEYCPHAIGNTLHNLSCKMAATGNDDVENFAEEIAKAVRLLWQLPCLTAIQQIWHHCDSEANIATLRGNDNRKLRAELETLRAERRELAAGKEEWHRKWMYSDSKRERAESKLKELMEQEPVEWQYQSRDGSWHQFLDQNHRTKTIESDEWNVRKLYAHPIPVQQVNQSEQPLEMVEQPSPVVAVPEFLLEMSKQMREQDSRSTSHPFWQVRCKCYIVTEQGYNEHHWEICGDDGVIYSSLDPVEELHEYLIENHSEFVSYWNKENHVEHLNEWFEPTDDHLPDGLRLVYVQETEEIVTTHFTESDARAFIARKQHDYPNLYTYVESAYWSPQIRQLQDWIISLSTPTPPSAEPVEITANICGSLQKAYVFEKVLSEDEIDVVLAGSPSAEQPDSAAVEQASCHELKTDPEVFDAVANGSKTHEIRFNDRDFKVGDELYLRKTQYSGQEMREGKPLIYTGEHLLRTVTHVLSGYGLTDGWVILSLRPLSTKPERITEQDAREIDESVADNTSDEFGFDFDIWFEHESGRTLLAKLNEHREPDYKAQRDLLLEVGKLYVQVFNNMFAQCCSNGIKDAWGKPVDCTLLNEANYKMGKAIAQCEGKGDAND